MPRRRRPFSRRGWGQAQIEQARVLWTPESRADLRRKIIDTLDEIGQQGVKIARTIVPVDSGALRDSISYKITDSPSAGAIILDVLVDIPTREQAIKAYVVEFGRGHGPRGKYAKGNLPGSTYLRTSKELTRDKAQKAIRRVFRNHARQVLGVT